MSDAPPAIDLDHTVFSIPELEHLLAHRPGPSTDAIAAILDVRPALSPSPLGAAARQIALILTAAERWTVFVAHAVDARHSSLLVESPDGTLMAHPRGQGAWSFMIIDPQATIDRLVSQSAMAYARGSSVTVRTSTTDLSRTFTILRDGDEWGFAVATAHAATPELSREHATADEVAEHLSEFIGAWPNPLEH